MNKHHQHHQQLYLEFQANHEKLQHLHAQHETLENHLQELQVVTASLEELQKLTNQQEVLVPISNSIFSRATMNPAQRVIVGVGSNILVEKSPEEAARNIHEQISELSSILKRLEQEMLSTTSHLQSLQEEIAKESDNSGQNHQEEI